MSFSNAARRTGSDRKSSSPKKKTTKKKKQEFHTTRRRVQQSDEVDLNKVKERTITGLEHLGHQVFSGDKGSYGMEGWVKSLKLLLDDFESRVAEGDLPEGYASHKESLMSALSAPVDTSALDSEAEKIREEEASIRNKLEKERERVSSRLVELRNERERRSKDIETEKENLAKVLEEKKSRSFFSKLTGRNNPPTKELEAKIDELRSNLKSLEDEEVGLNAAWESIQKRGTDSPDPYADDWRRLTEIEGRVAELAGALEEKLQRAKEREEATESLAKLVGEVKIPAPEPEGR